MVQVSTTGQSVALHPSAQPPDVEDAAAPEPCAEAVDTFVGDAANAHTFALAESPEKNTNVAINLLNILRGLWTALIKKIQKIFGHEEAVAPTLFEKAIEPFMDYDEVTMRADDASWILQGMGFGQRESKPAYDKCTGLVSEVMEHHERNGEAKPIEATSRFLDLLYEDNDPLIRAYPWARRWVQYLFRDVDPDHIFKPEGRFYIPVSRKDYYENIYTIVQLLKEFMRANPGMEFQFKVSLSGGSAAFQRDHILIFFRAKDEKLVTDYLLDAFGRLNPAMFGEKGPHFTAKLARGLYFGEEPQENLLKDNQPHSFGSYRAGILERAWKELMWSGISGRIASDRKRAYEVMKQEFLKYGVSTDDPAFNLGGEEKFPYIRQKIRSSTL